MKKLLLYPLAVMGVVFLVIQFIPVSGRTNPPVESDIAAPADVDAILRRSCYDCHSHETKWPWYNRIAPGSWLMVRDVKHAREKLNFSTWDRYNAKRRADLLEEMWHEVEEGEMPLWFYVPLHPEAKLSEDDKTKLRDWTRRMSALYGTKAGVEEAVTDILEQTEKAVEDVAEEIQKAAEKALKAAEDASEEGNEPGPGPSGNDGTI